MRLLLALLLFFPLATHAYGKKKKPQVAQVFEPQMSFSDFASSTPAQLEQKGYAVAGEIINGYGQQIALTFSAPDRSWPAGIEAITIERDPQSGSVRSVTQVLEDKTQGVAMTNQLQFEDGTKSHCSNVGSTQNNGARVFKCATVDRTICQDPARLDDKQLKATQVKHFISISTQLKRVSEVSTAARKTENMAVDKDLREQNCLVLNKNLPADVYLPMAAKERSGGGGRAPASVSNRSSK